MVKTVTDILKKVDDAYQNNRQRLIEFFQSHGFDEQQAEQLTDSMKSAVYFLDNQPLDRLDIDKGLRKELKQKLKDKISRFESLFEYVDELKELVQILPWEYMIKFRIKLIEGDWLLRTRAGANQILLMALFPLFWKLEEWEKGQSEQVDLVYNLFVEFKFDNYGKGSEDYIRIKSELTEAEFLQHENIRKHWQQVAIKANKQGF
jgi:ABC-type sulfate transport system substrate-binding protein